MPTREEINKSHIILVSNKNNGTVSKVIFPQATQVGLSEIPSDLLLTGRIVLSEKVYTCLAGKETKIDENYTIAAIVPSTFGEGTLYVTLPESVQSGQFLIIKDSTGTAGTDNIVIAPSKSSVKIDGASSKTIDGDYGYVALFWANETWNIYTDSATGTGDITSVTAGIGLTGGGTSGAVSLAIDDSIVATVSGTTFTGATKHNAGLSGSLTRLTSGDSYLLAGTGIAISTGSLGQVTISNIAAGSSTLEWNERLSGAVDGANSIFTLAYTPVTPQSIMVFLNGILLEPGASNDFTIAGSTITLTEAPLPDSKVIATYSR